jgi:hypothetical protein
MFPKNSNSISKIKRNPRQVLAGFLDETCMEKGVIEESRGGRSSGQTRRGATGYGEM